MRSATFKNERAREMRAFSLAELLVILVIMGILVLRDCRETLNDYATS